MRRLIILGLIILLTLAPPASAHKRHRVGPLELEIGWLHEPAVAGFQNAIQVVATRGDQEVTGAALRATVLFGEEGSTTASPVLDLQPISGEDGEYRAALIPTRPGRYTFEIVGSAADTDVDVSVTSGPRTFDDVTSASEVAFPVQDPTQGELAERLERIDARVGELRSSIEALRAEQGGPAFPVALAVLGAGLVALAAALVRRRSPSG